MTYNPTLPPFLFSGFDIRNCIQGILHSWRYDCHFWATFLIARLHQGYLSSDFIKLWYHRLRVEMIRDWCVNGVLIVFPGNGLHNVSSLCYFRLKSDVHWLLWYLVMTRLVAPCINKIQMSMYWNYVNFVICGIFTYLC